MRSRPPTIDALTGVRALAAGWVLLFHTHDAIATLLPASRFARRLFESGFLGVDLVFVLSGFVISLNYFDRFERPAIRPWVRFAWLRLARIYPVHLLTLGMLVVLVARARLGGAQYGSPGSHGTADLFLHLLLVQDWVFADHESWNVPSWSLSAEWLAYLAFPLLALGLHRIRTSAGALAGAAAAYGAMLLVIHLAYGGDMDATFDGGLTRIAGGFTAGCFLCRLYQLGWRADLPWHVVAPLSVAAAFALALVLGPVPWLVPLFGVVVFSLARSTGGWFSAFLGSRTLQYGGRVSYALYLVQGVVLPNLFGRLPFRDFEGAPLPTRLCVIGLYLLACWPVAHLAHVLVEEKCRALMGRLAK